MNAPHLPALRRGQPYESLDHINVLNYRDGTIRATVSQVNPGVIRKDLAKIASAAEALRSLSVAQLLEICAKAGQLFLNAALPQSPGEYVEALSATSGLPHVMVRRNMTKIHAALVNMPQVLSGLTRGLDLSILDRGFGEQFGTRIAYAPAAPALGVVMPSNSPAVNSLWLPAIPLKVPVILKPGREEPWTPCRLIQAFIAAGCPADAFGFYPTDHEGARAILNSCGRALLFGDSSTTDQYANNPTIQIHGPGYSKILIGEDQVDRWPEFIDVIAGSIVDNGGRSCINASAVVVPRHAAAIADALAQKLGPIAPALATDENARLASFANRKMADYIDGAIETGLQTAGATDVTAKYRGGPRKAEFDGGVYLRPTIIHCNSFKHPLANREFLCPYASVVEVPQPEMLAQIGPSLAVTAITKDRNFIDALLRSGLIERLSIGPLSTMAISWDQPHEGNMFEFLYQRRSLERKADWMNL